MKSSKKNSFKFYGKDIPILSTIVLTAVVICCLLAFGLSTLKPVSATSTLTPASTTCAHAPAGVVSCYQAENNTLDSVSNNHGTPINSLAYAPGRAGQAFQFSGPTPNGATGVTVTDSDSLDFTNALTIEGWVNPTATHSSAAGVILSKGRLDTPSGQPYSIFYTNQRLLFRLGNHLGFDDLSSNQIPLNAYTHFAATYDGMMMKLYVNGGLVNFKNTNIGTLVNSSFNLYLGYSDFIALPFAGAVDEIALYNRPLSAAEIITIVNSTQPPPPPPPTPPACAAPPSGLVSWYRAEWDTGDTLGGNNATPQGNVTIAPGKVGQAFQVEGGAYLSVPDSPSLDFTNALTIEGWINPTTVNSTAGTVMVKGRLDICCGQAYSIIFLNQHLSFQIGNSSGTDAVATSNPLPLNSYTHFAATYDGTMMRLYINGVLAASKTTAIGTLINENLGLKIGSESGFSFAGAIDELSLYNRPLSSLEIAAIFNTQGGGKCLTTPCQAITVNPNNPALPAGQAGSQYNQTFTHTGGNGTVTFTPSDGALPNGLTLSTGGVLSGTPTAFGNFNFTVNATDSGGCMGARAYTLTINPCPALTVNPMTLANGFTGAVYAQTLTATGGTPAYTFAVSAGTLPGGLNLTSGGTLTGTPTSVGIFNFTVTATDSTGCTGQRAYSLIISGNGLQFFALASPVRLLDTRASATVGCVINSGLFANNEIRTQAARTACSTIPANATAITGNITVVPSAPGFLTLFPSSAAQPSVANSNFAAGEITNNVFTVRLGAGDGAFKIYSSTTTEVIVDVTGYYAPAGTNGLYFHPLPSPVRLVETRSGFSGCVAPGAPLTGTGNPNADPNQDFEVQGRSPLPTPCNSIPATAQVLVGNATSVLPTGGGYLTIYSSGGARPTVASSNYAGSDVINGPFSVKLGADGKFKIYTFATTHLVVDILGYYSEEAVDANGIGLLFNPLPTPVRLLETRPDFPGFPLSGCTRTNAKIQGDLGMATHTQQAAGFCGLPAAAQAVVGNVSVVNSAGAGFLTLFPGNLTTAPLVATSNYPAPATFGYNRHYFVGLSPGDGTFKVLTQFTTDLILDASGYFAP
jgi:hypothetical protein